jgi:protein arginine kinase activator
MPDRPVECSQCKKSVKTLYKEIVDDSILCTEMCADCPVLQEKLHGDINKTLNRDKTSELCCGHCGTSLESVKMGQPLGCLECYAVFGDFLVGELLESDAIPPSLKKKLATQRMQAIHIGKSPDKPADITLSSRLTSLNEALNEALKRENYEQAAWLRDQIKALTENKNAKQT